MSAKVTITREILDKIIHEVNLGEKKLNDFEDEFGTSKRTLQRRLKEEGYTAYRGYNVWSRPGETKEEVLKVYRPDSLEPKSVSNAIPRQRIISSVSEKVEPAVKSKPIKVTPSKKKPKLKRLNIEIDVDTMIKLKVIAAQNQTTLTNILTKLIKEYLDNQED